MRSILIQHRTLWSATSLCLAGIFLIASLYGPVGCTRTVLGGYSDSPDGKYRIYGRIYGAYGRSFLDNTVKTARISIVALTPNETLLFRREYRVRGSDVGWDAAWGQDHDLTVVFFEYPTGVSRWDLSKKGAPTNHIRNVTFKFDPKAKTFAEESTK